MTGTTISNSTTLGIQLTMSSQNPVLVTSKGSITASSAYAIDDNTTTPAVITNEGRLVAVQYGVITAGTASAVTNLGSIAATASNGRGIELGDGGTVDNGSSGSSGWSISGGNFGVLIENATGTVSNFGTINGTTGDGISIQDAGQITNGQSSSANWLIEGANGIGIGGAGTVINWGSIEGSAGFGVQLGSGSVMNGSAKATGRIIKGVDYGVEIGNGTVTNFGAIAASASSSRGVELGDGGTVDNGSSGSSGWSISGGNFGVLIENATGTVTNFGTINGTTGDGISIQDAGQITNGQSSSANWLIEGANGIGIGGPGTVINWGSIESNAGFGVQLGSGSVMNGSAKATGRIIKGVDYGVEIGNGTVTNFGSIAASASSSRGVELGDGGTVNNGSSGSTGGSISGGNFGVLIENAPGTINNFGTISGAVGLEIIGAGTVVNGGTIASAGGLTGTAVDFAGPGTLTEDPGSVIIGEVIGGNADTLELGSGKSGGSIGGFGTSIENFGTVSVDAGATWSLTGANVISTISLNGTIGIGSGGSLDVSASVAASSSGTFQLTGQGSLEIAAALGTDLKVQFLGSSPVNKLTIDSAADFGLNIGSTLYAGPLLEGFAAGDMIDLKGIASAGLALSYSATSGDLQITGSGKAVATLLFQNSSLGAGTFQTATDGSGGTLIKLT